MEGSAFLPDYQLVGATTYWPYGDQEIGGADAPHGAGINPHCPELPFTQGLSGGPVLGSAHKVEYEGFLVSVFSHSFSLLSPPHPLVARAHAEPGARGGQLHRRSQEKGGEPHFLHTFLCDVLRPLNRAASGDPAGGGEPFTPRPRPGRYGGNAMGEPSVNITLVPLHCMCRGGD